MEDKSLPPQQQRIGFHYFPDLLHYRDSDLSRWLPELQSLGSSWITLTAPDDYTIPEAFIKGLIDTNIRPILHFKKSTSHPIALQLLKPLLEDYAKWGVRYVVFYDRPNQQDKWLPGDWAHDNIVERFLDLFIPCAEAASLSGLTPVLPPLEPGGNYWDTAFLYDLLSAITRRGYFQLVNQVTLSAYAQAGNRQLNWGAGGPERWPASQPYNTPKGSEDQQGFRIFDWYLVISTAALGKSLPIILFDAGCHLGAQTDSQYPPITPEAHAERHMEILHALVGEDNQSQAIPSEVIACIFGPLFAEPGTPEVNYAWYQSNGNKLRIIDAMQSWVISHNRTKKKSITYGTGRFNPHPIAHYLLVKEETWNTQGKYSTILKTLVEKYKPTTGYSVEEAAYAHRVTIFGDTSAFPDAIVDQLISAGCIVERIPIDGTVIASRSSETNI